MAKRAQPRTAWAAVDSKSEIVEYFGQMLCVARTRKHIRTRFPPRLSRLRHVKIEIKEVGARSLKQEVVHLRRVLEAARRIHHWHDAMADNSGMVVSASHVRALWKATRQYDQFVGRAKKRTKK